MALKCLLVLEYGALQLIEHPVNQEFWQVSLNFELKDELPMHLVVYCSDAIIYYYGIVCLHNSYGLLHILQCQDTFQTVKVDLAVSLSSCFQCVTFWLQYVEVSS